MDKPDNEQWLEAAGGAVRARRLANYMAVLPRERLTEILWLVSRSMRETGDLVAARHHLPDFLRTGHLIAQSLALPRFMAAFGGSEADLEDRFFAEFNLLCDELRDALAMP
ncbi:hypothetical protein [Novosphingobium sp.]|uniref:hypothetical protein n=1 Tax=Novosphingobium sp. TaxID=1874826 RepID=UPI0031D147BF